MNKMLVNFYKRQAAMPNLQVVDHRSGFMQLALFSPERLSSFAVSFLRHVQNPFCLLLLQNADCPESNVKLK